jgi:CheY-like chemotaxis protein
MTADLVGMPFSLDVLVVEDNEVNAMVASGLLERIGHRATVAPTDESAVERVRAHDFDVVLMDLRLPDIDGVEATKRIRALAPRRKGLVPIIALSAQVAASDVEACLKAGIDELLGKPFRLDRLEATLRRAVLRHARRNGSRLLEFRRPEVPAGETQSEAGGQPIDVSVLALHVDMLGLDQTARIVAAFESTIAGVPEEIEQLAFAGERGNVANLAHRLKSSSLHVGLLQLSKDAAALEGLAQNGDDDLAASAGTLAAGCRDGLAMLKRSFAELAAGQPANT